MPSYKIRGTGKTVTLTQNHFCAKGGEGTIYIDGGTVYKICDPGKMIPEEKFKELSILSHPRIIRPTDVILDNRGDSCGYTMTKVPGNAMPLASIFAKAYRELILVLSQSTLAGTLDRVLLFCEDPVRGSRTSI